MRGESEEQRRERSAQADSVLHRRIRVNAGAEA
jgi:hypothetical protein